MEFGCSVCEYTSAIKLSVVRHINKKQSCGPGIKEIIEIPIEIKCEYCNKLFTTSLHLTRHQKNNCKAKIDILEEKNKKLERQLKEMEKQLKEKSSATTINNNTINVYINNYENTSLDKITDKVYNEIINDSDEPYQIIPRFIKHLHCNPNIPENHNIRISNRNKNNKYNN